MAVTTPVPPPDFTSTPRARHGGGTLDTRHAGWFTRITIAVVVLIWLIPAVGVLVTSFRPVHLVETTGWWTAFEHPFRAASWTLQNYRDALDTGGFQNAFLNSLAVTVPSTVIPVTLAAFAAGVNVLVEKPIAATREEATRMIEAAHDAGRMLTVGHIERFNPAIRELRRRLADGELGRVFQVHATRLGPFPARIRDVGVVVDLAPHDLDIMRYLIGSEPIRIFAETERRIHTEHEDLFNGMLKFANGVIGVLDINWLTPMKKRTLSVTGERGMYVADYIAQDLVFYANPEANGTWVNDGVTSVAEGEMTRRRIDRQEPLTVELTEFAAAVRSGGEPPVDPHDAMVALLLARKMVESAESGQVIAGAALEEVIR
jgi:predicted dehydrogenase